MTTTNTDLTAALIASVLQRKTSTRWGIGTAANYLRSIDGCPLEGISTTEWQKALKEAEGRLTWCDEEMGDAETIAKSVKDSNLPDGFCAAFDCTLTSKRIDRDGDVLEPKGMAVDANMPLLWQHLPMQPIGKMVKLLTQDDQRIRVGFGIVDTKFGNDVALLVKTGCLRMSHGFKPFEFDPITHKEDKTAPPSGWHIKSGEIREGSVVSIPSNVDGVIEAYHGGGLKTPLVREWAKHFSDARPVIVPVNIELKVNGQTIGTKDTKTETAKADLELPAAEPRKEEAKEMTKEVVETPNTSVSPESPPANQDKSPQETLAESTVAAPPETAGAPDGDASGVVDHGEKCETLDTTKAGKVLSAKNMKMLTQARDMINTVCESAMKGEGEGKSGKAGEPSETKADAAVKADDVLLTKMAGMEDYIEGSFEWTQDKLQRTAVDYLRGKGKTLGRDTWARLIATFPTEAVICVHDYNAAKSPCYRIAWAAGDDGPAWSGDAVEVEIKPQVIDKIAKEALAIKASKPKPSHESIFRYGYALLTEKTLDEQVEAYAAVKSTVTSVLDRLESQQVANLVG